MESQERQMLFMKFKIKEIAPSVAEAVKANDGYCPCMLERNQVYVQGIP